MESSSFCLSSCVFLFIFSILLFFSWVLVSVHMLCGAVAVFLCCFVQSISVYTVAWPRYSIGLLLRVSVLYRIWLGSQLNLNRLERNTIFTIRVAHIHRRRQTTRRLTLTDDDDDDNNDSDKSNNTQTLRSSVVVSSQRPTCVFFFFL